MGDDWSGDSLAPLEGPVLHSESMRYVIALAACSHPAGPEPMSSTRLPAKDEPMTVDLKCTTGPESLKRSVPVCLNGTCGIERVRR